MGKPYSMANRVHKIQRHTVCIIGHKNHSWHICDHPVNIWIFSRKKDSIPPILSCHCAHIDSMCLSRSHHIFHLNICCVCKSFVVFHYCFRIVPSCETEIHGTVNSLASPSQSGTESVDKLRKLFKNRICQIDDFPFFFYVHQRFTVPSDFLVIHLFSPLSLIGYYW